jgi:hypothetical protein
MGFYGTADISALETAILALVRERSKTNRDIRDISDNRDYRA